MSSHKCHSAFDSICCCCDLLLYVCMCSCPVFFNECVCGFCLCFFWVFLCVSLFLCVCVCVCVCVHVWACMCVCVCALTAWEYHQDSPHRENCSDCRKRGSQAQGLFFSSFHSFSYDLCVVMGGVVIADVLLNFCFHSFATALYSWLTSTRNTAAVRMGIAIT